MVKRKKAKLLAFRYTFLALIFIILAGGLVFLPQHEKYEGIKPEELLIKVISPERYISPDELAHKIITQDTTYLFIDVREEKYYNNYTLPNAINIPLAKLLDEDSEMYLNQDSYNVVLFSNDNFYATQAWSLCTRLGFKNISVLKGGLNNWFNTIINPPKPKENSSAQDLELYNSRKSASKFFGVVYPEQIKSNSVAVKKVIPKKVIPVKKKKKMPVEGGC